MKKEHSNSSVVASRQCCRLLLFVVIVLHFVAALLVSFQRFSKLVSTGSRCRIATIIHAMSSKELPELISLVAGEIVTALTPLDLNDDANDG